jgi:26S proteasome regulatory subunit N8
MTDVLPLPKRRQALRGLAARLQEIQQYMGLVLEGKLPINHDIMTYFQDIFNLLPNMNVESLSSSLAGVGVVWVWV